MECSLIFYEDEKIQIYERCRTANRRMTSQRDPIITGIYIQLVDATLTREVIKEMKKGK